MNATQAHTTTRHDPYPSRVGTEPAFLERVDPVVYDDENALKHGPLTPQEVESYERNGFLFLKGFFAEDEVRAFQGELDRLREDPWIRHRRETITEPGSGDVRSVFRVHELSPPMKRLSRDPRIVDRVRQLLASDVSIMQSRINYKPGFRGKEFYWHSDFETWHIEDGMPRMRAISCSISLTDNTPYNGPVMVLPGSHKKFLRCVGETPEEHYKRSLKKQELGVPDDESLARMFEEHGIEVLTGPPGSMLLFDCNLMHGSNSNITPVPRSNIFFVYNSVENELVQPYCGLEPRPDFIADRDAEPLGSHCGDWASGVRDQASGPLSLPDA